MLHKYLIHKNTPDVIEFIVDKHPEALGMADCYRGGLPLDLAVIGRARRGEPSEALSLEVVKMMVDRYPDSVKHVSTPSGFTALHSAARAGARLNIIDFLVETYPEAVSMVDKYGNTPFWEAVRSESCLLPDAETYLNHLLQFDPNVLKFINPESGGNVLHRAAYNYRSPDIARFLVKRYPEALTMTNHQGDLPLHTLLRTGAPGLPPEMVAMFADPFPVAVMRVADSDGKTPLDKAKARVDRCAHPKCADLRAKYHKIVKILEQAIHLTDAAVQGSRTIKFK